jgi:predicted Zn-dependent protease with MMP-like domain
MRTKMRTIKMANVVVLGAILMLSAGVPNLARADDQAGPSDDMVNAVMKYAWAMLPNQFTNKDGNVILVDKSKKDSVMVPIEVAREVVRVGRVSAHAQVCNMPDDQALNHRSMMKREVDKKTWTDQQKLWINQIHLTTVMLLTGKIKAVEKDDGKEVAVMDTSKDAKQTNTCTTEQATAVKDRIKAYVDAGPKLPAPEAAAPSATASTAPAAPAAAPVPPKPAAAPAVAPTPTPPKK